MKTATFLTILGVLLAARPGRAEVPEKYRETVSKGLAWLAKEQDKDGSWKAAGGSYTVAMTGLSGVALLNEGSTFGDGKFAGNIRRAARWLMDRSNPKGRLDGLIGDLENPAEAGRYMFGHSYAMLFLSRVFGDIDDRRVRKELQDVLTRAVQFSAAAQSTQGGWFYTSRVDGHDADEGAVTVVQLQALQEARKAGIAVPKAVLDKAKDYLKNSTTAAGGVIYSLPRKGAPAGGERPALTAGALAALFTGQDFDDPLAKQWFKYCGAAIPLDTAGRLGYDEFLHYYYAQAIFRLGDDGWKKMFPKAEAKDQFTWTKYRAARFDHLQKTQEADGSWKGAAIGVGPIYSTAANLTIMQLDNTVDLRR